MRMVANAYEDVCLTPKLSRPRAVAKRRRGGRLERLVGLAYSGSLAARTSTFSMDGGLEKSSSALAISAAATLPER